MGTDVVGSRGPRHVDEFCIENGAIGTGATRKPRTQMIERVTAILDCFTSERVRLTLRDLAQSTELPRSTTHRILDSLVDLDWIEYDGSRYLLGSRSLRFGGYDRGHLQLRSTANPYLVDLHMRTGMTVAVSSIEGSEAVVLDVVGSHRAGGHLVGVGHRGAAYQSVAGRAMLATMTPEAVDELISNQLPRRVNSAVWTRSTLHCELNRIRRGLWVSRDPSGQMSVFPGIARAIMDSYGVSGAVSLHPAARQNPPDWQIPLLVQCVQHVTNRLHS